MSVRILGDPLPPARDTLAELVEARWEECVAGFKAHTVMGAWIIHQFFRETLFCAYHAESTEPGREDIALALTSNGFPQPNLGMTAHSCVVYGDAIGCFEARSLPKLAQAIDTAERIAWEPHLSAKDVQP